MGGFIRIKMVSKIKLLLGLLLVMLVSINFVSAYELKFEEGYELEMYEEINPITLHLIIDNTDPSDYISDSSELSYLELKVVGKDENFVRIVNERDFRDTGMFIDKDVKENIEIELRLPTTEKWQKEYEVMIAGVSPDERQREAKIIVKPTGEQVKTVVDEIPWPLLIGGLIGLILIIIAVVVWDKIHGKGRKNY